MLISKKGSLLGLCTLFFTISAIGALLFNLWLPSSIHLARSSLRSSVVTSQKKTFFDNLLLLLTSPSTSRWLLRKSIRECSLDEFKNGERLVRKNNVIYVLVSSLEIEEIERERVLELLEYASTHCDVNKVADDFDYPPLAFSIITREKSVIEILLRHGASVRTVIQREGKPVDGMNALQLAEYLESKASTPEFRDEYAVIVNMLRHHENSVGETSQ